jgi:hypothetical protein
MERQRWWPIKTYTVDHSRDRALRSSNGSSNLGRLDSNTAREMLKTDFEQAFIIHNDYKDSERDLFKLSLKILAFPGIIAGALLSAKLISSSANLSEVLRIPLIWLALMVSGILDTIVVRAYVVTDRVQTEAKHQVNRLRALYLHALADEFPPGWTPVWGSTNPYLETRVKFKAAAVTPIVLGALNALYLAVGADQLLARETHLSWHAAVSVPVGILYLLIQLEFTWQIFRKMRRRADRGKLSGS